MPSKSPSQHKLMAAVAHNPKFAKTDTANKMKGGGLYENINAKRKRIAEGSGEKMRRVGSEGAPTAKDFKQSAKTAKVK